MSVVPGTRLGPYEIIAPLVADPASTATTESYTARDTRLDRIVAIRILPADWVSSPERKQHFDREARLVASLNHPNICKVHDFSGTDSELPYLVTEHLSGETLAARLGRGALPVREALRIAIAVADALDQAHRQGVVHRDLKPASIVLTPGGPKLVDFSLTGSDDRSSRVSGGSDPARVPTPITQVGATLGTLQYLAPEQLDGLEADARTDIFALGVVLHEMITGRRAFEGKSQVLLISAIATSEPPALSEIHPAVPPALDHVVTTCLAKDPDARWQTARDLAAELRWIAGGGSGLDTMVPAHTTTSGSARGLHVLLLAAAGLVAGLGVLAALYFLAGREPARMEIRVPTTPVQYSGTVESLRFFAISPDGRRLALRSQQNLAGTVTVALYVATLDFLNPQLLAGTDNATQPFWSPDGREIAYFANGKLFRIEASGGPARPICDAAQAYGGTWNRDGQIIYGSTAGLFSVNAEGGKPMSLTTLEPTEVGHFWPRFLPDGRRFLYLVRMNRSSGHALFAGSLDSKERTKIADVDSNVTYSSGFLLFRRQSSIYAQAFDLQRLTLSGDAVRLADGVPQSPANGRSPFDVSDTGALAYYRDLTDPMVSALDAGADQPWQLTWVGRTSQETRPIGKPGIYRGVEVSRDGTRIAVHRHDGNGGDVWVLEPSGTETKITFNASQDNSNPVWSTDGSRLTYASLRQGQWGLYRAAADGSRQEELLYESELPKAPMQWSPDGAHLLFWVRDPKTSDDLWIWTEADKKARPLIHSEAAEKHGQISPDGKWIAYSSTLTSRPEIYVQPFPSGSAQWQISPDVPGPDAGNTVAGDWPRWSPSTNELFYLTWGVAPSQVRLLSSVSWKAIGSRFVYEPPRPVMGFFALQYPHSGGDYHTYAVAPDAQRMLIYQGTQTQITAPYVSETPDPPAGITALLNWVQGIRK